MKRLVLFCIILLATFLGAFGSLYLKKASGKLSKKIFTNFQNTDLFIGIGVYLASSVLFITALKYEDVSVLYPLTSVSYIWASLLAMRFLNEKPNKLQWIGIIIIMIGVTFIGLS